MSKITDFLHEDLYPQLYGSIDRVFTEHDFKRYPGGWRSKTYLDGKAHNSRADKTVITQQAPGRILEQGGDCMSLVDYVIRRDGVDFIQAVRTLAQAVGLELPAGDISPEYKERQSLLEDCNSYFIHCLTTAKGSDKVRAYLNERDYSEAEINAMELGYIADQAKLFKHLQDRGHSERLIEDAITIDKDSRIGSSHVLTIAYRHGGTIKGFKFRAIEEATPKYLNTSGLDRSGGFFNLSGIKGDKDLVIVEGELDSLHATVKGIDNVVATGGSSINEVQVRDAIRRGAKSFTLCFDTEPGKERQTEIAVNRAIEVILGAEVNRVSIVILPNLGGAKTDPDSYIKAAGKDAFIDLVREAAPYFEYRLQLIIDKYARIQDQRPDGLLNGKDVSNLLEDVIQTALKITDPIDRDRFKKAFIDLEGIQNYGITEKALSDTLDKITTTRERQAQARDLGELINKASELHSLGEVGRALEILEDRLGEVRLKDKATEFSSLLIPVSEAEIKKRLATKPESLDTGYKIEGEELLLPSGAITVIAAPTSHGKTTLLLNMAITISKAYPDKETYFFGFEEDGDTILLNALNTYIDEDISKNNRRSITSYYSTGSQEFMTPGARETFTKRKEAFFSELVQTKRLNIRYTDYDTDTLIDAIRFLHKNANPAAIFIDYIQLLNLPEGKYTTYSRQQEMKKICDKLKDVAVKTGLPIVLGAQFNREVVSHLKIHATKIGEAGDIERVANLILGLWNTNFDAEGTEGELKEINKLKSEYPNSLFTKILKNRGGRVGLEDILDFNGNTGKITNRTKHLR